MSGIQPAEAYDFVSTNGAPLVVGETTLDPEGGEATVDGTTGRVLIATGVDDQSPVKVLARITRADYDALDPADDDVVYLVDDGAVYVGALEVQDARLPSPDSAAAGQAVATDGADGYELAALAAVATSGSYNDLSDTPTLGTAAAEDLAAAVDTEGVARVVFIENGGEIPEGVSAWTLVVELPEE